jgi:hypothetical protein
MDSQSRVVGHDDAIIYDPLRMRMLTKPNLTQPNQTSSHPMSACSHSVTREWLDGFL